ncbi:hypothetical protein [Phage f2b1]|nr:hypothetical protein [Phage f2b1]
MRIDVNRLMIVMDYLQRGGEVYYEGRTLVWLDEHTVREDDKQRWVIDGLALKTKKVSAEDWVKYGESNPDVGETYYMGHDMSVSSLVKWINDMSPIEYRRIMCDLVNLRSKDKE